LEGLVGVDLPIPIALPHDLEMVAVLLEKGLFLQRVLVHFLDGAIEIDVTVLFPMRMGMATRASVPETATRCLPPLPACLGLS